MKWILRTILNNPNDPPQLNSRRSNKRSCTALTHKCSNNINFEWKFYNLHVCILCWHCRAPQQWWFGLLSAFKYILMLFTFVFLFSVRNDYLPINIILIRLNCCNNRRFEYRICFFVLSVFGWFLFSTKRQSKKYTRAVFIACCYSLLAQGL